MDRRREQADPRRRGPDREQTRPPSRAEEEYAAQRRQQQQQQQQVDRPPSAQHQQPRDATWHEGRGGGGTGGAGSSTSAYPPFQQQHLHQQGPSGGYDMSSRQHYRGAAAGAVGGAAQQQYGYRADYLVDRGSGGGGSSREGGGSQMRQQYDYPPPAAGGGQRGSSSRDEHRQDVRGYAGSGGGGRQYDRQYERPYERQQDRPYNPAAAAAAGGGGPGGGGHDGYRAGSDRQRGASGSYYSQQQQQPYHQQQRRDQPPMEYQRGYDSSRGPFPPPPAMHVPAERYYGGYDPRQAPPPAGGFGPPPAAAAGAGGGPPTADYRYAGGSGSSRGGAYPPGGYAGGGGAPPQYGGGGAGRMFRGEHSGGVAADRGAPYNSEHSRTAGFGAGSDLQPLETGQQEMAAVLAGKAHNYSLQAPSAAGSSSSSSSSSQALTVRPGHGTVAVKEMSVLVNLYALTISGQSLYHYDVSFERLSTRAPRSSSAQQPASAGRMPRRPPENARDIMSACFDQYWRDDEGRPLRDAWAFDGSRNLVTAHAARFRGGLELPRDSHSQLQLEVRDVPIPGKSRNADWQVTIQLTRVLTDVQQFQLVSNRLTELLAAGRDSSEVQQVVSDMRQPLEWVLKQAFITARRDVMEFGRILYFPASPGNRNIGGGLRAITGLLTSIKTGEQQPLLAADLTTSAFWRTDINLVEVLAEVADCHMHPAGAGGGGRGGFAGRGGGRGRGRSLPEVGAPDVRMLMQKLERPDQRQRLLRKFEGILRNKKLVYKDVDSRVIRKCTAVRLLGPAREALFYCEYKQPTSEGKSGEDMSVADYYAAVLQKPLLYPHLPVVEMKTPRPKEGERQRQLWIPMERLCFDKNQRMQLVTHKGGVEQMIEAARKQPGDLASAIQQPVGQATSNSSSKQVLSGMGVDVDSNMQRIKARVLPGPRLSYREGPPGREVTKAFNTGSAGQWNMQRLKFAAPARLRSGRWGCVAFLPRREYDGPEQQRTSLAAWVYDQINRFVSLGMDMDLSDRDAPEVAVRRLRDSVLRNTIWLEHEEATTCSEIEDALRTARERAGGPDCQLIMCFIRQKPSPLYSRIKVVSELVTATGGLGLVTQVVVANKTDLGARGGAKAGANQRSQYQANLAMKINAKVGGVNTQWAVMGEELLRQYLNKEVPPIQVFGIDVTHPGRTAGARSKAAVVGSLDPAFCRYAQAYWEEETSGSEALSKERLQAAFKDLIKRYYTANNGRRPGVLLVYRDGVSDTELQYVRSDEVSSILAACSELSTDYRPRIVYVVVQKRHLLRFFDASRLTQSGGGLQNLEPGTVIDHTVVSPQLFDFYLNSHREIRNTGTSRASRYICLLDELGLGPDGLQVLTYWMCYLYCRCTRSVSVVAPVYYAHLLAYRVRVLDQGDDSISLASGSSGASAGQQEGGARHGPRYCDNLAETMFFV